MPIKKRTKTKVKDTCPCISSDPEYYRSLAGLILCFVATILAVIVCGYILERIICVNISTGKQSKTSKPLVINHHDKKHHHKNTNVTKERTTTEEEGHSNEKEQNSTNKRREIKIIENKTPSPKASKETKDKSSSTPSTSSTNECYILGYHMVWINPIQIILGLITVVIIYLLIAVIIVLKRCAKSCLKSNKKIDGEFVLVNDTQPNNNIEMIDINEKEDAEIYDTTTEFKIDEDGNTEYLDVDTNYDENYNGTYGEDQL